MIKKKVCMLGAFAAGKTSLVQRYVTGVFSEKYLTTIGVKIDKKTVELNGQKIELLLWDIHGEDKFQKVQSSYLRGAAGYFLVVDGSRRDTLETAHILRYRAEEAIGNVPFIIVVNKADLKIEWEIDTFTLAKLKQQGFLVIETSAKTGEGVTEIFTTLTAKIMED